MDGTSVAGSGESAALRRLIDLGIALSAERNHDRLLEQILLGAKELTNADGGTLYLRTEDNRLAFEIMRTDTLGVAMGGTTGKPIPFPGLKLYNDDGTQNHNSVATHVALAGETINIADAYDTTNFDFSGAKAFDAKTGYRSKSFLAVPLKNHENEVIGVIQLINARVPDEETVISFSENIVPLVEALASQAAMSLENQRLIQDQRNLFDAFIKMMASAVDAKSPYTGGHCQRVPVLTEMLADAACKETTGPFADFKLTEDEWYELQVAGGLHDVGKVTTPVHIMDKSTKLEKICDRIDQVRTRFEVMKRDVEIAYWKALAEGGDPEAEKAKRDQEMAALDDDFEFLAKSNVGGEFMADAHVERVGKIAKRRITEGGVEQDVLSDDEIMNLCIRRGTLNDADRKIINDHIVVTIQMLESLPFPKMLKRVPTIAGGHHEKMDGTGYPNGLKREDMSVTARMMGVADIFEALTAADRPYKAPKTLSESIKIMGFMKKDQHIDAELFELFLRSGVYKQYAERFLLPEQIDEVDIEKVLAPPPPKTAAAQ
jgi:HD-GYP domain-containing protein (c-di-GMP phosphodiesterase class II)